jgi:hypothetical protein
MSEVWAGRPEIASAQQKDRRPIKTSRNCKLIAWRGQSVKGVSGGGSNFYSPGSAYRPPHEGVLNRNNRGRCETFFQGVYDKPDEAPDSADDCQDNRDGPPIVRGFGWHQVPFQFRGAACVGSHAGPENRAANFFRPAPPVAADG